MGNDSKVERSSEFEAAKARLEEIAQQVDDDSLSLDEALDLYEEAVKLGLQVSDLLEVGIEDESELADTADTADAADAVGAADTADAAGAAGSQRDAAEVPEGAVHGAIADSANAVDSRS